MKVVQCYKLFGGIAPKNLAFLFCLYILCNFYIRTMTMVSFTNMSSMQDLAMYLFKYITYAIVNKTIFQNTLKYTLKY